MVQVASAVSAGNVTVDAGPILDKMFAVLGTDDGVELLLEMSEKAFAQAQ